MEVSRTAEKLTAWLKEKVHKAGAQGVAVGLSGGIDSATVAALCKRAFPHDTLALIMPCHSSEEDEECARLAAEALDLKTEKLDLSGIFDIMLTAYGKDPAHAAHWDKAVSNLKPRLRMITLYYFANLKNYLVVGTGNRSELSVGYFTKYGDGGVDLLPIGGLVKKEIRELASYLGVPQRIIERKPTAGLWKGQTDEEDMGLTYEILDHYLLTGEAPADAKEKIQRMQDISQHKRQLPPIAPV